MQKTVFQNQNYNNFKNPVRGNDISTEVKPKELPIPLVNKTEGNIKLTVTEGLINKIRYICGEFPTKEWSGVLFYDIKGSLKKPNLIEIKAFDFYPLDLGSASYTEFEYSPDFAAYIARNPLLMDHQMGLIHSHNNMSVFFSGTDTATLQEQAPLYKKFLSVIVNNRLDIVAKLAVYTESDIINNTEIISTTNYQDIDYTNKKINNSSKITKTFKEKEVWVYDCDIIKEGREIVDEEFKGFVEDLKTNATKQSFNNPVINTTQPLQRELFRDSTSPYVVNNVKHPDDKVQTFICCLASQNFFYTPVKTYSLKENLMAAMRAVPKTIDRDLYINMLECSIDLLLDYMEIHLEEDIIDILDSAYQGLKIIGIHNNKDLSSLVFEVIESTLNSYLEDLVETEGFVYEAPPEDAYEYINIVKPHKIN
ncbi:MAG: hypothetical protein ACOX4W_01600 [Bacilli bacterium]